MHARQLNAILVVLAVVFGLTLVFLPREGTSQLPPAVTRFAGPTASQPLALTGDDTFLLVVNPDNNTLTAFDVRADRNRKLLELPVQTEPNSVAVLPDGTKAYVANTVSGTVTALRLTLRNGSVRLIRHIPVGTEPYGLALTPNGRKLYISNARSNTVSVIDTASDTVVKTILNVGVEPRGIAISNNGDDDDNDERVYVTQFLASANPTGTDGSDNAKSGQVTVISTATDAVIGTVSLNPMADTGFRANGDALSRIPPGTSFVFQTGAYPNQLNNIAILGNFAFVPSTGASPNGPVRFDVNTQSLLSAINRLTNADANVTLNMHTAVQAQLSPDRTFITVPWAMAFKHTTNDGYVVSAASDLVVKLAVNPVTGTATVQSDPTDPARVLQIPTGKNPRGIVLNSTDTRAYVMNYVSRDVTVLDLTGPREAVMEQIRSAALPTAGTLADTIQIGKELYNSSLGEFDSVTPGTPITRRMSKDGWGSCASCHPNGLSDGVTWIVNVGPRRAIAQHATFDQTDPTRSIQRALNWSATFDEVEDFELFIRNVSGGDGLIVLADGITPDTNVTALIPLASGGRNQLKVRGVGAWDALKAYVQFGIRAPISPVPKTDPDVVAGRALFTAANCQQCHGGAQWTSSRVRFTPPPAAGIVNMTTGEIIGELRNVGTFNSAALNEVRANGAPPLGANGYNPPSLLSVLLNRDSFFHNGAARTLDEVLQNVTHRSAGTGGVDTLTSAADRAKVVKFLQSIDAASVPFP